MEESQDRKISRSVYTIIDKGDNRKAYWMKVGIAYQNRDSSWNVYLDVIPFDRKLQIREDDPKYARGGNGDRAGERLGADRSAALPAFDAGGIQ